MTGGQSEDCPFSFHRLYIHTVLVTIIALDSHIVVCRAQLGSNALASAQLHWAWAFQNIKLSSDRGLRLSWGSAGAWAMA